MLAVKHAQAFTPERVPLEIVAGNQNVLAVPERDKNRLAVCRRRRGGQGTVGANLSRTTGNAPLPTDFAFCRVEAMEAPQLAVAAGRVEEKVLAPDDRAGVSGARQSYLP